MDAAQLFPQNETWQRACPKMGQTCPTRAEPESASQSMKHRLSQQFFAYWDQKRGEARAPDRSDLKPDDVRELLGDVFVLACDEADRYPFRVAGTRLCALFGRDLKDKS